MAAAAASDRPLAVTADEGVLDDLVRLAEASGATLDVAPDPVAARRTWSTAPLVVVGAEVVGELARASPPRRRGVIVVGRVLDDAAVWESAVALGADEVVPLPDGEALLTQRLADAAEGTTREGATVCVLGGRGGAGASTLAAGLAVTAAGRALATFLVDGDPLGGGIDLVLGGEDSVGLRWQDLVATEGRVSAGALRSALPRVDELVVLSLDRGDIRTIPREAMRAVLGAARRGGDLVVVDLPRHVDAAAEEALAVCTTALLVVPAEVRAVAAATRVAAQVATLTADVRVVVRGPSPARLDAGVVAETLGLPLAGQIAAEPRLAEMLEYGEAPTRRGRGPLAAFCRTFLGDLGLQAGVAA